METHIPASSVADPSSPTPSRVLRAAQAATLARAPRQHGLLARTLFATMDVVYGKQLTLERFEALELIARVPYQAWEGVGYVAITHVHARPAFARRIFDYVREARAAQDNEQWHLFILEELLARRRGPRSWLRSSAIPQVLAFLYYHVSWLLYVLAPRLSYALNADFEDHAERGYMQFVGEHPAARTAAMVERIRVRLRFVRDNRRRASAHRPRRARSPRRESRANRVRAVSAER